MGLLYHFLADNLLCIFVMGSIGFLGGCFFTRRFMAPAFCPNCLNRNQWISDLKGESKEHKEKAESRRFYWLRRKKKDTEKPDVR